MKKPNWSFVLALLFGSLFLMIFAYLAGLGGFEFHRQPVLGDLSPLSQYAGELATLGCIVAAGVVAVQTALQPGSWGRKVLTVLPIFCLGLLVSGIAFQFFGLGTVGRFTMIWLTISALLALVSSVGASALLPLERTSLRVEIAALGVMGVFSLLTWLATVVSVGTLVLNPGGPGGAGPGGPPVSTGPLLIGAALLTLFGVLAWATIVRAWRNSRKPAADAGAGPIAPTHTRQEAWRSVVSLAGLSAAVFVAIQFVPVSKTNAPVQTPVTWDSPQSEALFRGACADCHSNETVRPWYDYIAPSSWLLASHISAAHARWNLSELNNLQPQDKKDLPNLIADALHNDIMPPSDYQFLHPAARLSPAEKDQLIAALKAVTSK